MSRLTATIACFIGDRIDHLCKLILFAIFGLRLPAARIREHDLENNREFVEAQLLESIGDVRYWMNELARCDASLASAKTDSAALAAKRQAMLNIPTRRGGQEARS